MFMARSETTAIVNELLQTIGIGGLMGVTVVAATITAAFDALGAFDATIPVEKRRRCINELKRQDLIIASRENDRYRLQLSVKGIHRLQRYTITSLTIDTPAVWNGQWHMVVFDIPSRHNTSRYILTSQLRRLGFVMVQDSVWVHPYPCSDIIQQITAYANLQPFVTIAEITQFDARTTQRLRRHYPELYL